MIVLGLGLYASRQAGKSSADFFLSGRNMPWWHALFAIGFWIYGQIIAALIGSLFTGVGAVILFKAFRKLRMN